MKKRGSFDLRAIGIAGLLLGSAVTGAQSVAGELAATEASKAGGVTARVSPRSTEPQLTVPEAALSAGTATVFGTGPNAFGRALGNLRPESWPVLRAGKRVFVRRFEPPGPGAQYPGLGPLFNADSCSSCHFKEGRGRRPQDPGPSPPLIVRLEGAGSLGHQLQDRSVSGSPEGGFDAVWSPVGGDFADGTPFELRRLEIRRRGPWAHRSDGALLSPRQPPHLVGMGLLEAVPDREILSLADPDDADGDGISGRVRWLDPEKSVLGRFGWRSGQATLRDQVRAALAQDMGVLTAPHADLPEMSPDDLEHLVRYVQLLGPPARRQVDSPAVVHGEALFSNLGCAGCHHPELRTATARSAPPQTLDGPEELAGHIIRPYTNLLLHDMGDGLADATGREWRTAPLWGLGLLETVSGEIHLLHDGRARSFEEAILWHGGEAEVSKQRFLHLDRTSRHHLVRFLQSL